MIILLAHIWKKFQLHIDKANYKASLARREECISVAGYSTLCSLGQMRAGKGCH